jgi:GTP-binding protein
VQVVSAEFVTSAASAAGVPRDAPHVAMVGRSNVGKSTLINALLRQRVARTSAAAGKTRLLNFYRVTFDRFAPVSRLYLVDLPGYGYARGGETAQEAFKVLLDGYFGGATRPAAVLHLVDARHPGLPHDVAAWEWIRTLSTRAARPDDSRIAPTDPLAAAVVATKIDKLSRAERRRALETWTRHLNAPVTPVSAATGEGMNDLWTLIVRLLRQPPMPTPPPSREPTALAPSEPKEPDPSAAKAPGPSEPKEPGRSEPRDVRKGVPSAPKAGPKGPARSDRNDRNDRPSRNGPRRGKAGRKPR